MDVSLSQGRISCVQRCLPKIRDNLAICLPLGIEDQGEPLSASCHVNLAQLIECVGRRQHNGRQRLALPRAHAVYFVQPLRLQAALQGICKDTVNSESAH